MALDFQHRLDPRFWTESKTQPPTGHRMGLRERSAYHHSRAQVLRQLACGERLGWWICEVQITLIADHPDVVLRCRFDDFLKIIRWNNPSGWVIGRVDDQQSGAGSNRIPYRARSQQKPIRFGVNHNRLRTKEL